MLSHVCVQLFETLWTIDHQAPSTEFSRQEYCSGLTFSIPNSMVLAQQ